MARKKVEKAVRQIEIDEEILKQRVSQYSPELQRLNKVDWLAQHEPFYHLNRDQVLAFALYRAFHEFSGIKIDGTIKFLENYCNLSPSIDRLGRQEIVVILAKPPRYQVVEGGEIVEESGVIGRTTGGIWEKIKRFWRGRNEG